MISSLHINGLYEFSQLLPRNTNLAKKLVGSASDSFSKYASCPTCHSLYPVDCCKVLLPDKTYSSLQCSYIKFPHHPQAKRRQPCNDTLMKKVKTSSGTISLYPRQLYCYRSVKESLKLLVAQSGFVEKCELWRVRKTVDDTLTDIYDGQVWQDFLNPEGIPFLSLPYNFALSLNIDWFQPFKYTTYSAGAIYIAVQNLPRSERYCSENVILVGIIPGPHEPKKTVNSYMQPLVAELNELWKGVVMQSSSGISVLVRAALICTACDIPASRKVSGFVGHSAYHACSRCLKEFPTSQFGQKPDFSGTDRDNWILRSKISHNQHAHEHKNANTYQQQKIIEREHGCRYSVLIELPYYNVIRFCVIDPMHNLLLGTAKHMLTVWTSIGIIEKSHFLHIQEKVDAFITPSDIGRIPSKISSGFSSFTAEQWRNWTLIYSLCSLKDVLPYRHYDCWLLFVKATSIICRHQITIRELSEADALLMEFCHTFELLYGKQYYTINMHLHAHLKDCILDFGPVYSFWLFSFERLNGMLGSYHTNCHDISLQLMRRFTASVYHSTHNWPMEYKNQLCPLISSHHYQQGSLQATSLEQALQYAEGNINPLPPVCEAAWQQHQKQSLACIVHSILGHNDYVLLTLYEKCKALSIAGFVLGSARSRFTTKFHVMAFHPQCANKLCLARIEHFSKLDIKNNQHDCILSIWTACVSFFDEHPCKVWFGGPTQVWTRSVTPDHHYIKLSSIKCRVAYCETKVDFGRRIGQETVFVVSLLSNFSN